MPNSKKTKSRESEKATKEEVYLELCKVDPSITWNSAAQITEYLNHLINWNSRMNLVGPRDWKTIVHKLIADSLHLADFLGTLSLDPNCLILDIGAGAGLPGIPLRILCNQGLYIMLEPQQKRAAFLQFVTAQLKLPKTLVQEQRIEDLDPEQYKYELILSRAFRSWKKFLSLAKPFLTEKGCVLVFSTAPYTEEQGILTGWIMKKQRSYFLIDGIKRYFWLLTPKKDSS